MFVCDPLKNKKQLGSLLAQGGEGGVYPLIDREDILIKVYHDEKLAKNRHTFQKKIDAMTTNKADLSSANVCWPLMSVYNEQQQWIGYAMKKAQGIPMMHIAHALAYQKYFPTLNRIDIVQYLLSFLSVVEALHQKNIFIGDYNLQNFLCDPNSDKVTMIDCDSYQVSLNGQYFACPVGSPDFTPVEHQGKQFKDIRRDEHSERFSVAIIVFMCLMLGKHPFDFKGGEGREANIKKGYFPYGPGGGGIPKGAWFNIWSHMPYKVKSLFMQAFDEGTKDKHKRPTIKEWKEQLKLYLKEMNMGWHNTEIKPEKPKEKDYRGQRSTEC
jgi:DNA-binding helix-hairpin-helix protein with protein kinase domain